MPGHRSYCFTINNPSFNAVYSLLQQDFKYMIIGFEKAPKTGTPHIQGWIQFYGPKTDMTVRAMIPLAHIEVSKGTPQQNIQYCSKDGVWFEYGDKPTEGGKVTFDQVDAAFRDPEDNMTIIRLYGKAFEHVKQTRISASVVDTKYYTCLPVMDAITEIIERLGDIDLIIVQSINELAAYDSEDFQSKTVVLLHPIMDQLIPLYPRGVPIKYKYGYQYHTCKPRHFVVVSDKWILDRLTGYKKI